MAFTVHLEDTRALDDYEVAPYLAPAVHALREAAAGAARALDGSTVWMVNSTALGGGVAEMLPTVVSILRDLGVSTEWVVIEASEPGFFGLTKRLHNLLHGDGDPSLPPGSRDLHEEVNRTNADYLRDRLQSGDVLVVHDPQPMPLAAILRAELEVSTVWRCHIGLDTANAATRAAWEFLAPYADAYDRAVFSAPEYVPDFFSDRASIIYPAIDPLSDKNRELHRQDVIRILSESALISIPGGGPGKGALRFRPDGRYTPANEGGEIGLLTRPIVTEVSRWDRLKGFAPLLEAFARMKRSVTASEDDRGELARSSPGLSRLVLSGPDPSTIQDDPEGMEVLQELESAYLKLEPAIQEDVALLATPQDPLLINALQRVSTIVVQNSLREGFGLTITEAMWKGLPVVSNTRACGPRQQIRDRIDGRLIADPEDTAELAAALAELLEDEDARIAYGRSARSRVLDEFLVLAQVGSWLRLLAELG